MSWKLEGRTAFITGAAQGLGAGIARSLHAKGMNVVITGRRADALELVAQPLGDRTLVVEADVTDLAQLERAVGLAKERFGGLDVVVANAGVNAFAPLAESDPALFRNIIETNLMGVYHTLRATAPEVFARQGYFQVVASMATAIHSPLQSHYCASKAAIWALADSFRLEARAYGAAVGTVHPTFAATAMMEKTHDDAAGREVWNGNRGLWSMVSADSVVAAAVRSIERRERVVTVPKRLLPVLLTPGLLQPLLEKSFTLERVKRMIEAYRSKNNSAS